MDTPAGQQGRQASRTRGTEFRGQHMHIWAGLGPVCLGRASLDRSWHRGRSSAVHPTSAWQKISTPYVISVPSVAATLPDKVWRVGGRLARRHTEKPFRMQTIRKQILLTFTSSSVK